MADKRISQLNALTSPTGSDLLVIVNNNETKKITYANLVASITGSETDLSLLNQFTQSFNSFSASVHTEIIAGTNEQDLSNLVTSVTLGVLSGSVDGRLDSLEASTGSYETKGRGILSGSVSYLDLTNIPQGIVSQSTDLSSLNAFTASYFTDSASVDSRLDILQSWSSSLTDTFATDLEVSIVSSSVAATIGIISQNAGLLSTSSFNSFTQSIDGRVDLLESWSSSLDSTFATDLQVSIVSSSVAATIGIISQATGLATTGSNTFYGDQEIDGQITASYYLGDGRYLNNLSATTNWNYNQEYTIKKTEQLTFSGDYMLENTYLYIEGGQSASIGEWGEDIFTNGNTGSITRNSNNQYTLIGPSGDTNGSNGVQIKRLFDTETTMSVSYAWNGTDVGEDRPYYDVSTWEPTEPSTTSRLQDTNAVSESGTWTINVPSGSWVAIGVWTDGVDATSGSLQITLPYILNEDISQYSSNKYFKKEGSIFIGGNLLVKDSTIVNNGKISVGGEVILIGNSEITGTGTII